MGSSGPKLTVENFIFGQYQTDAQLLDQALY